MAGDRHPHQKPSIDVSKRKIHPPFTSGLITLASEQEISDFLKEVEKRAFKRTLFHVKEVDAALDIVQDSMIRLCDSYGSKPLPELRMLFNRILSNATLDWFRRRKTHNALFSNMDEMGQNSGTDDGNSTYALLENYAGPDGTSLSESAEDLHQRTQLFTTIEKALEKLPARQREAFIMRYWEDMDVAETAAAMGCSEGSVKTHCHRATQTLSVILAAQGIKP